VPTGTTFYPDTPQGRNQAAAFGVNTLNDNTADDDPYAQWLASPIGQNWNTAQEAAAAQARQQADADMANKLATVKQQAQRIAIEKGTAAANAWYQKQEAKLAQDRLDQEWKIHQDQFGLDTAKFNQDVLNSNRNYGLDYAKAYTQYASGPDTMFQMADFQNALGRVGQGLGVGPLGNGATPTPRNITGFNAIAGVGAPSGAGYTPPAGSVDAMGAGATNANGGPATPTGTGSTADPRITAANAIMKAIPPTDEYGHDPSTAAALSAIQNIYAAKKPGAYQKLLPGQEKAFGAGLARLGYDPNNAIADMTRAGIGQGSVTAAY
jgi:hypothetical protein